MTARSITIALLPFENLSGAAEDGRLANGFVHDLIAEIARFPTLGVIAAQSSFSAVADHRDDAEIGQRLGVDYLLKGSIRRSGQLIRIIVHLVQWSDGRHLWSERYDIPGAELFVLQDEIAARVANTLCIRIDQSALAAARSRQLPSLAIYECWLRGMELLQQGTCEGDDEARRYFQQAIEADPHYARAAAGLSLSYFNEWSCQAWHQWEEKESLAYEYARQAEALDPDDQIVQMILGRIEQYRRQHDVAAARFQRALTLAPNDATALIQLAACFTYNGNAVLGAELGVKALALNPLCPGWYFTYAALPSFTLKQYQEAASLAGKGPGLVDTSAYQAAAYAFLGNKERASFFLKDFNKTFLNKITFGRTPGEGEASQWLRHVNPYRREEDSEHLMEGLRIAGMDAVGVSASPKVPVNWPISNTFRKEGSLWTLSFEHETTQVPELRGWHDLVKLLGHPGEEFHCLSLVGLPVDTPCGQGTEMLDEQARRAYQTRLREIQEELADAEDKGDPVRYAKLEEEKEAVVAEIKRATGLGGRNRKMADPVERARTAVTWRIRHAIKKLDTAHPSLSRHLANAIRTGVYCSYMPEKAVKWFV